MDIFAGPGGWDLAARKLGIDPIGIEWDDAAVATRDAAGLRTQHADVAALDPIAFAPVRGLIGSPPCPTFSDGGNRAGIRDAEICVQVAHDLDRGVDTREAAREQVEDGRSLLVVEPIRWALALKPEWIALEQVEPVLPIWETFAEILVGRGYYCWTGVLNAADYGVPQARHRAFLLASRTFTPTRPEATHSDQSRAGCLFGMRPWITMGEALGVGTTTVNTRGDRDPTTGGNEFQTDRPSWTVTGKARSWKLHTNRGQDEFGRRQIVSSDRPAPTVTGKSGSQWHREDERGRRHFTVDEIALVQSFPIGYPWQGSRTKQFEQIGNAVPPLMAEAALAAVAVPTRLEVAA